MKTNFSDFKPLPKHVIASYEAQFPAFLPSVPRALNSGNVEALSSFLCRQAEDVMELAHPYSRNLLNMHLKPDQLPACPKIPAVGMHCCNGIGIMANRYTEALNIASDGSLDSRYLTLLPLEYLSDYRGRGFLKSHMAWCDECWKEDMELTSQPYVRLYWLVQNVKICTTHRRRLSEYCPICGEIKSQYPTSPRQWLCDHCGSSLYLGDNDGQVENFTQEEEWAAFAVFRLIERTHVEKRKIGATSVSRALTRLLKGHNLNSVELSHRLNIDHKVVDRLISGPSRPHFPVILDLCYRLDIPPDQFIFDLDNLTDIDIWRTLSKPAFIAVSRLSDRKKKALHRSLQKALIENPTPPVRVSHLAQKHGISYTAISAHFPREFSELRKRWVAWDRKQRRCSNTERLQNISDSVFSLVRHGVYPSERKLRDLGYVIASDLRREDVKQLLSTLQDIFVDLK